MRKKKKKYFRKLENSLNKLVKIKIIFNSTKRVSRISFSLYTYTNIQKYISKF